MNLSVPSGVSAGGIITATAATATAGAALGRQLLARAAEVPYLQLKPEALVPVHAEGIDLFLGQRGSVEARAVAEPAADDGVEKRGSLELTVGWTDQNFRLRPAAVVEGLAGAGRALEDLGREVQPLELRRVPSDEPTVAATILFGRGEAGGPKGEGCRDVVIKKVKTILGRNEREITAEPSRLM